MLKLMAILFVCFVSVQVMETSGWEVSTVVSGGMPIIETDTAVAKLPCDAKVIVFTCASKPGLTCKEKSADIDTAAADKDAIDDGSKVACTHSFCVSQTVQKYKLDCLTNPGNPGGPGEQ